MVDATIFKAYDVRGIYPEQVNDEVVSLVGNAAAKLFGPGKIIIGHDGRHGSKELAATIQTSFIESAKKHGKDFEVVFIGLSTTPMFYFLVYSLKAAGGMMITASHNPSNYNGVKIVGPKAKRIGGIEIKKVIDELSHE